MAATTIGNIEIDPNQKYGLILKLSFSNLNPAGYAVVKNYLTEVERGWEDRDNLTFQKVFNSLEDRAGKIDRAIHDVVHLAKLAPTLEKNNVAGENPQLTEYSFVETSVFCYYKH
jgi:hypothetical protein